MLASSYSILLRERESPQQQSEQTELHDKENKLGHWLYMHAFTDNVTNQYIVVLLKIIQ